MKINDTEKIAIDNPKFAMGIMLFLIGIPYFFDTSYTPYRYVEIGDHIIFVIFVGCIYWTSLIFNNAVGNIFNNHDKKSDSIFDRSFITYYKIYQIVIIISIATNFAIVVRAVLTADFYIEYTSDKIEVYSWFAGLNILSQAYMGVILPYIYLSKKLQSPPSILLVFLAIATLMRSFLVAERLAFVEFALAVAIGLAYSGWFRLKASHTIVLLCSLPAFFIIFEGFRSYNTQIVQKTGTFQAYELMEFGAERFVAYYRDVMEKFYFVLTNEYFFETTYWQNEIYRVLLKLGFPVYSTEYFSEYLVLTVGNSMELVNQGGLTILIADFGYGGFIVLWFIAMIFVLLYRWSNSGHLLAMSLYPVFYITIVELPRYVYLYHSRGYVPILIGIIVALGALLFIPPELRRRRPAFSAPQRPPPLANSL